MYKLGKKVSDDGVWKEFNGAKLLIGRAGTVEYLKAKERLEKPYKKRIDRGTLSINIQRDINLKSVAETLLLDWKGVGDEKGKSVSYTPELGVQALKDDPDMLELVMDVSLDNDNFSVKQEDDTAKKSS